MIIGVPEVKMSRVFDDPRPTDLAGNPD